MVGAALFVTVIAASRCLAGGGIDGAVTSGGARATLSVSDLKQMQTEYVKATPTQQNRWKYRVAIASCDVGGVGASAVCYQAAVAACAANTSAEGRGPLSDVFRMWVKADGTPLPPPSGSPDPDGWVNVGSTCLPQMVPGAAPTPTVEMIVEAFHETAWAEASISTQPTGDTTLVGLKTFYQANWADHGFEPGEIDAVDPAAMFGYTVEIRPRLESFVYHFGDGSSFGPTTSPGGVYPDGHVVHTYARPGHYDTHVDVTFGARFRINGGAWVDLPDTVTVRQPSTTVTVREAKGVLVNH